MRSPNDAHVCTVARVSLTCLALLLQTLLNPFVGVPFTVTSPRTAQRCHGSVRFWFPDGSDGLRGGEVKRLRI
ncbi:hypothetical protein M758_11G047000 [Ceratodon purpureus]|nr:hypothetical protein M758_11G047000 [Ceratodon purpureus]